MKKTGILFLALALVTLVLSSCGAHRGCEAYSQADEVVKKEARS